MYTYSEIVPDRIQEQLIAIRDSNTHNAWRLGDLTNLVIEHCKKNEYQVLVEEIYSAVGSFAGKAARTVREYASMAKLYPLEARMDYEELSFDHFTTAATMGERRYEALDWAVEQIEKLGRPATVDAMLAKYCFNAPEPPPLFETEGALETACGLITKLIGILPIMPYAIRQKVEQGLKIIQEAIGELRQVRDEERQAR